MFKPLKPRGDVENFGYPNEDTIYREESWKTWHYAVAVLLVFPLICIPILFGLVAHGKTTKNYYEGAVSTFTVTTNTLSAGQAISLDSTGTIQAGAGTSIYRNIAPLATTCPKYLNMDAVYENAYLVSHTDVKGKQTTLQVVTVDDSTPNAGVIHDSILVAYSIAELATLSTTSGLFVGICMDNDGDNVMDYIIAGKVDANTGSISPTLGQSKPYGGVYSMSPTITRLSDTSFAIAYFGDGTTVNTRYGTVDPTTLAIELFDEVVFADNTNYNSNFNIVGLGETTYALVFYHADNVVQQYFGYGPLNAKLATVTNNAVVLGDIVNLNTSTPVFNLAAARLSATSAVIAFADYSNNFGINTQLLTLNADNTLSFGSSLLLSNSHSSTAVDGVQMDLDVTATSDDGKFLVLYSDFTNQGAMTATEGQVTAAAEIVRASPDFLLNSGSANMGALYAWGAVATGSSTPYAGKTAILSSVTDSQCTVTPTTKFSFMDSLPGPFGVISPNADAKIAKNSKVDVCVAGIQSGYQSALTPGAVYYANTLGDLVKSSTFYGHEASQDTGYYYDAASDTILTSSSRVGFAASAQSIFVQA